MPIHAYLRIIQEIVLLISGAVAIYVAYKYGISGSMRWLFCYALLCIAVALASISQNWFKIIDADSFYYFKIASSIFHYSFLSLFILFIKKPIMNIKPIKVYVSAGIVMACLLVFFVLCTHKENQLLLFIINNFGLFVLCCFYFVRLFSSTEIVMIKSEASFWAVSGLLICMCISLPFAAYKFFLSSGLAKDYDIQQNVFYVAIFGYIIMHLFFIKAYLCLKKQTAS